MNAPYGGPSIPGAGWGNNGPVPPNPHPALPVMPDMPDMGGQQQGRPAWISRPFYPTAPLFSTNPYVGHQVRYYSTELLSTESDYAVGSESIRTVPFDIPCRLVAINGAAFPVQAGNAFPSGIGPRDCWLVRLEYSQGDKLHVTQRLASTYVGTAQRPGEIGAQGWTIYGAGTVTIGITPLIASLTIHVVLVCLETRARTNHGG